jgi:hypothetical protein
MIQVCTHLRHLPDWPCFDEEVGVVPQAKEAYLQGVLPRQRHLHIEPGMQINSPRSKMAKEVGALPAFHAQHSRHAAGFIWSWVQFPLKCAG